MEVEIFDINREDTKLIKEMAKKEFSLEKFRKEYGKNRVERLVSAIKKIGIIREIRKEENPTGKGKKISIYKVELPIVNAGYAISHLGKGKRFLRTETDLF